jgi:hypothetical protein
VQYKDEELKKIAILQADAGNIEEAIKTAKTIEFNLYLNDVFTHIAESKAKFGFIDSAKEIAGNIQDIDTRLRTLSDVAIILAENGKIEAALSLARGTSGVYRSQALQGVADFQAKSGDFSGAVNTALEITKFNDDPHAAERQANTLADISILQAKNGLFTAALETAKYMEDIKDKNLLYFTKPLGKKDVLSEIAILQARSGDLDSALKTIGLLESETDNHRILAEIYAESGNLDAALDKASRISNHWERANALFIIATTFTAKTCGDYTLKKRSLRGKRFLEWYGIKIFEWD